ncbi:M15 family metallopeptidase [Rhodoferax sp.]|uniref:M15 family metallopeptidase n=1 Tax=Rhodoferax sp. TaxID=50421 RepID=UPI0027622729|nr:M15 family metallopeptidase [Rhodoferax sp.]
MQGNMDCELIAKHADFRPLSSIPGLAVDLRYADHRNFVGRDLYGVLDCAWLHREAALGLHAVVAHLRGHHPGLILVVLDALRPHRVQVRLWEHLAGSELRQYLADPVRGSIHSFGMAVDVTLLDRRGVELDMGTAFDDLSELSQPKFESKHLALGSLTDVQIANRVLLQRAMRAGGFHGISSEWWHFDCGDRERVRRHFQRVD